MVYFFYGENTYSLKQNLDKLKERFAKEQGDINISEIDGASLTKDSYTSLAFSLPFLSSKRLVIIKNLILEHSDLNFKKYVAESVKKIPDTTVLIFAEFGNPDSRQSLFKALNQSKTSKQFAPLPSVKLNDWIVEQVKSVGGTIGQEAIIKIQVYCGNDLWRLENEINKLVLYQKAKGEKEINVESIEKNIEPVLSPNIFDFIELIASDRLKDATKLLSELVNSGENELKILSMIIYQFRTMLIIDDLISKKIPSHKISMMTKLHPFVVKKTLGLIRKWNKDKLVKSYFLLNKTDISIKKGTIDSKLALDLLISQLNA